jgi:hypothetical protein
MRCAQHEQEAQPMTGQLSITDVARQHRHANTTAALATSEDFASRLRPLAADSRLGIMADAFASAASACLHVFLDALHDSRRKQAAIELARHRDLIYDPETGIAFGMDRTLHPRS